MVPGISSLVSSCQPQSRQTISSPPDDLNAQAAVWCAGPAAARPCPEDTRLSVVEAFEQERPLLLALPADPFSGHERLEVRIGKTPYARFDPNACSIPHTHVRRTLTVLADTARVRVVDGVTVLVTHARNYDRGAQIEDPAHLQDLVDHNRGARQHRVTDVPHPNTVRLALDRRRDERKLPAATVVTLPEHLQRRDVIVTPHLLDSYDQLTEQRTDDDTADA